MNRNLSPQTAKGMFGGPRGKKGNYLISNQYLNSGGILMQASTVNGNKDTVRKLKKSARMKP
jgi:hypothetical protein